jgi:hypothetical protein
MLPAVRPAWCVVMLCMLIIREAERYDGFVNVGRVHGMARVLIWGYHIFSPFKFWHDLESAAGIRYPQFCFIRKLTACIPLNSIQAIQQFIDLETWFELLGGMNAGQLNAKM